MLKPGEVATALFAYSDQAGAKRRPVLVISSEEYNAATRNAIVAAISSKPPKEKFEYGIKNWKHSGLKMPSKVRAGTLQTVSEYLLNKIGSVPGDEYLEVKHLLTEILGLTAN
jgi:mRNA-degrading endonuclease toxin of MazEF toxin-antitoxin module